MPSGILYCFGLMQAEMKLEYYGRRFLEGEFVDDAESMRRSYRKELEGNEALSELVEMAKSNDITLLYATRDTEHNSAVVLQEVIQEKLGS